ncbi:MAG: hypothetical protein M1477_02750 [Candidatus Thermoplasmatota archaeon]|jgi:hypothetical protein|nr:hypothetical protein [Candidatus Thermoplasmatota archaeon]MCL5989290.1 hypothetical protein [Candidatus Thermoplasmatota archaeon]
MNCNFKVDAVLSFHGIPIFLTNDSVSFLTSKVGAEVSVFGILLLLVGLVVAWILSAFFIWIAAKIVTGKRATFGRALLAALLGPIVFEIFYFIFAVGLFFLIGPVLGNFIAIIISILVLSALYGSIFRTGILGGFLIAILVVVVTFVIIFIVGLILGISMVSYHALILTAPIYNL